MNTVKKFRMLDKAILALGAKVEPPGFHTMHHSNAAKVWTWQEQKQQTYTLAHLTHRFALRLTFETHVDGTKDRVILFGRELFGRQRKSGNTARATFNSTNITKDGYFISPNLGPGHRMALQARLSNRALFPKYIAGRLQLGNGGSVVLVKSFLRALSFIEEIKKQPRELLDQMCSDQQVFTMEDLDAIVFNEGRTGTRTHKIRKRSMKLRKLAAAFYKGRSEDGRLHCYVNNWAPNIPVRGDIVQIHHDDALASYPKRGKRLTFHQAIKFLFPLCPNCHRLLESKPGGGRYSIPELRSLLKRRKKSK